MNLEASSSPHPPPSRKASIMEGDDEQEGEGEGEIMGEEEQDTKIRSSSSYRSMLPSDGYEWKKYGQKFIKHIGKFRSYFKCQRRECGAKKTAEWCKSEPSNIRVVYNGHHSHHSSSQGIINSTNSTATATHSYNLFTQVFGDHHHHHHLPSNSTTPINHDDPN